MMIGRAWDLSLVESQRESRVTLGRKWTAPTKICRGHRSLAHKGIMAIPIWTASGQSDQVIFGQQGYQALLSLLFITHIMYRARKHFSFSCVHLPFLVDYFSNQAGNDNLFLETSTCHKSQP